MRIRWAVATLGVIALAALTVTTQMPWLTEKQAAMTEAAIVGASNNPEATLSCPTDAKPAKLDFTLKDVQGKDVDFQSFKGKVVLLDFWATWCTACEAEMPEFQRGAERYRSQGMTVLAVNYRQTDAAEIRRFLSRLGTRFPTVFDPDGRIASAYGVSLGLPVSVFIDRSGKVSFIQLGQISSRVLDDKLRSIL